MRNTLFVVSHTHWDREWYESFQEYRLRLVRMLDSLIELMEQEPDYRFFHLDGQTIVLEDYLEIRPQNRERLYALIRAGRIWIGPWYVMPDPFLVSGESLVRNLQKGMGICRDLGVQPMRSGYMVDLFGFNNQFPQILRGFGIDNAVLYRGVGDYPKDLFEWRSPDGSQVTVAKLDPDRSYSNFYFAVRWPFEGRGRDTAELVERMGALLERSREAASCDVLLMMDGVDHIDADPDLPAILAALREAFPDVEFRHAALEDYFRAVREKQPELETVEGPLYAVGRQGLNNALLKNVLSSYVKLKQANDEIETMLTAVAEPLDAFLSMQDLPADPDDVAAEGFLERAWTYVLENHPHDSICGCSVSCVHADNAYRFRQARELTAALNRNMEERLARHVRTLLPDGGHSGALLVRNHGQSDRDGVEILRIPIPHGEKNLRFYDWQGRPLPVQILDQDHAMFHRYKHNQLIAFGEQLYVEAALPIQAPGNGYTVVTYDNRISEPPRQGDYSYARWEPPARPVGSMRVDLRTFDTGVITVTFETDGTLTVVENATGKRYAGLLTVEDSGDNGDGYNYVEPLRSDTYLSGRAEVAVEVDGPLAARIHIATLLRLPQSVGSGGIGRSGETKEMTVDSWVTLRKGSGRLDVRTAVDNTVFHHRLRMLFPTGLNSDVFYTKTPFAMCRWDIASGDWGSAKETETFVRPSQGITLLHDESAALALYTKGLYEVAVSEDGSRTLAVTLFRSFAAQVASFEAGEGLMPGRIDFAFALDIDHRLRPETAAIRGEDWRRGLSCREAGIHDGELDPCASLLKLEGRGLVLSAVTRAQVLVEKSWETAVVIRFYNAGGESGTATLTAPAAVKKAYRIDLEGRCIQELAADGRRVAAQAGAGQIVSVALFP